MGIYQEFIKISDDFFYIIIFFKCNNLYNYFGNCKLLLKNLKIRKFFGNLQDLLATHFKLIYGPKRMNFDTDY